jgi:hypothetical protein
MNPELNDTVAVFWWAAIGIGVVVIACIVVLLTLLRGLLIDVDRHVTSVAAEIEGLADNITATVLLEGAASAIAGMGAELGHHVHVLTSEAAR